MKGQWIGVCDGTNTGNVFINIDEFQSHFGGNGYLFDNNHILPASAFFFKTENKNKDFHFRAEVHPVDPRTGVAGPWEQIKKQFLENVAMPTHVEATGTWWETSLRLDWISTIGTNGTCICQRSKAKQPSILPALDKDWNSYKTYVAGLEGGKHLFRGQNKPWRLQTSFHRTGRADLYRFLKEDIQTLYKHLSARTKHVFNLQIPDENGAFFNLVQHHGYPTPLLDWTYSPYVAAFFAYRGISKEEAAKANADQKVRIHIFDQAQWKTDWNQIHLLLMSAPHLSIEEFMAVENERMIPQQAASTLTNIDDIETYIQSKETPEKKYLSAIDLPLRERSRVINELKYMGITAGSLFPGLDGACEELRERNFEI